MDCSLPGSFVHGIFQARVLEWGAIAFSNTYVYIAIKVATCEKILYHVPTVTIQLKTPDITYYLLFHLEKGISLDILMLH